MNCNALLLLFTALLGKYALGSFLHFDTALDPQILTQNQVFLNRKEKFIKFDTDDNNLEVELGISIPFIKVPLAAGKTLPESDPSKITINAPGALVAGMLMLTSFLVVPLLFGTTPEHGFGFQRKGDTPSGGSLLSWARGIDDALSRHGIEASSCMGRSICWMAQASRDRKWLKDVVRSWWMTRMMAGTLVEEAVKAGFEGRSCGDAYRKCSLTKKHLESLGKMAGRRR